MATRPAIGGARRPMTPGARGSRRDGALPQAATPVNRTRVRVRKGSGIKCRGRDGPFGPPPAQIRTGGITAYGSCLGSWPSGPRHEARFARPPGRSTRGSGSESGTRASGGRSPWPVAFPPPPPPTLLRRCSATSQVLRNRPTPHGRACRTLGHCPSPTGPPALCRGASVGSPGSRAWSIHACSGSQTPRGRCATGTSAAHRVAFPLTIRGRRPGAGDFGAQWLACVFPCQRLRRAVAGTPP